MSAQFVDFVSSTVFPNLVIFIQYFQNIFTSTALQSVLTFTELKDVLVLENVWTSTALKNVLTSTVLAAKASILNVECYLLVCLMVRCNDSLS